MNKKTQLAISMGLLFSSGTVLAQATDTVGIDWDGSGGFTDVGALDWAVGSSYADGAVTAGLNFTATGGACDTLSCDFDIYTHAALQGYQDPGGNPGGSITGLNSDFEWTFIFGGKETITANNVVFEDSGLVSDADGDAIINGVGTFGFDSAPQDTGDGFFFEIYYDDLTDGSGQKSDALNGLGYNDGQLIMSASSLDSSSGTFEGTQFSFEDNDADGALSAGDRVITDPNETGFVYQLLDSFGADDWFNALGADETYWSVVGEGGTQLEAEVDQSTIDGNFFEYNDPFYLIVDQVFSTENVDPFLETNPSQSYDVDAGGTDKEDLASGDIVLGDLADINNDATGDFINGASNRNPFGDPTGDAQLGEDILFQTDANQGFRTVRIPNPEPGTLALLGLGLGFLSLGRRRRSHKVNNQQS